MLDLEHALVEDWSPVRSSEAVRAFLNLIRVYGGDRGMWARLTRHGSQYDRALPGFSARTLAFVRSLVDHAWVGEWPFAAHWQPTFEVAARKAALKARWRRAAMYPIYLAAPGRDRFMAATRDWLNDVLCGVAGPDDDVVVLHNAFEPFDPTRSMRFFDDVRVIIVDRDPRDVYVAAQGYVGKYNRRGWSTATTESAESFIDLYRTYRGMVRKERDDSRVLRITFEKLVVDYETIVPEILRFVGKRPEDHVAPRRWFDPVRSAAGVGAWRTFPDQNAMRAIEKALPEFCAGGDHR